MGRQQMISRGIAGAVLLALAAACSHSGEPVQVPGAPAAVHLAAPRERAVVAMPALLGLPVDTLAQRLGGPRPMPASVLAQLAQLPRADSADSMQYFHYRSLDMVVSYNAATRRFHDLLLLGANEDLLVQRAGLSAEAAGYLLLPVFHVSHPMQQLGLRVVPVEPTRLQ